MVHHRMSNDLPGPSARSALSTVHPSVVELPPVFDTGDSRLHNCGIVDYTPQKTVPPVDLARKLLVDEPLTDLRPTFLRPCAQLLATRLILTRLSTQSGRFE